MVYEYVDNIYRGAESMNVFAIIGSSAEHPGNTKPTIIDKKNIDEGTTYFEADTYDVWFYNGSEWKNGTDSPTPVPPTPTVKPEMYSGDYDVIGEDGVIESAEFSIDEDTKECHLTTTHPDDALNAAFKPSDIAKFPNESQIVYKMGTGNYRLASESEPVGVVYHATQTTLVYPVAQDYQFDADTFDPTDWNEYTFYFAPANIKEGKTKTFFGKKLKLNKKKNNNKKKKGGK